MNVPSKALFALSLLASVAATSARAQEADDRLMIVSRNSGRIISDNGRNDLYCVTSRYFAGYDEYGHRIHHRSMRCR